MFCYNLSERAADNILPQMANVLPQCLYHFYEFILPYKKFELLSLNLFETGQQVALNLLHTF